MDLRPESGRYKVLMTEIQRDDYILSLGNLFDFIILDDNWFVC